MGMRPGKAKGPYVGSVGSGGGGGSTAAPAWYNLGEFTYQDFATGAQQFQVNAIALPANSVFYAALLVPTEAFLITGGTQYDFTIGIAGTLDLYLPTYEVYNLAPGALVFGFGSLANGHIASLSGWDVVITANSDVDLGNGTAGAFTLAVQYAIVP